MVQDIVVIKNKDSRAMTLQGTDLCASEEHGLDLRQKGECSSGLCEAEEHGSDLRQNGECPSGLCEPDERKSEEHESGVQQKALQQNAGSFLMDLDAAEITAALKPPELMDIDYLLHRDTLTIYINRQPEMYQNLVNLDYYYKSAALGASRLIAIVRALHNLDVNWFEVSEYFLQPELIFFKTDAVIDDTVQVKFVQPPFRGSFMQTHEILYKADDVPLWVQNMRKANFSESVSRKREIPVTGIECWDREREAAKNKIAKNVAAENGYACKKFTNGQRENNSQAQAEAESDKLTLSQSRRLIIPAADYDLIDYFRENYDFSLALTHKLKTLWQAHEYVKIDETLSNLFDESRQPEIHETVTRPMETLAAPGLRMKEAEQKVDIRSAAGVVTDMLGKEAFAAKGTGFVSAPVIKAKETYKPSAWEKVKNFLTREVKTGAKHCRLLSEYCEDTVELLNDAEDIRIAVLSAGIPGTSSDSPDTRSYILVDEFTVGRDPANCDFVIESDAVSRVHAQIRRVNGSFFLEDTGSLNGTLIDGRKIPHKKPQLLPDKCRLTFGDKAFYFYAQN